MKILFPYQLSLLGLTESQQFFFHILRHLNGVNTRVWHGESKEDIVQQADPLINPSAWAAMVKNITQKLFPDQRDK
ncbi:hypothetical protein [aff. Roholtiella sp. LEGE 12411]|uniref:hypothetical protein n=1 Tax=aff. Roholtiella sp. LEGE 12411 TaxID=1828822 RepID=UPI0018804298|nr:hypothetical protein [aff. Roholtiella sp. LEGE 12411]MBE9036350.1 hypothetical protein [aff. Roholtiella sp. LEGE 12411]